MENRLEKRDTQSDLVRVVAMFFVIAVHTPLGEMGSIWQINYITRTIFFTCNAMFFMLSGKYNLRFMVEKGKEKEAYIAYYKKKVCGIAIPFLVWSVLLYFYEIRQSLFDLGIGELLGGVGKSFFCVNYTTHLWFMYSLIGMLLGAPFLARMLNVLSDLELNILVICMFVWNFLNIILFRDILDLPFAFSGWIFEGWIIYFILGFYCDRVKQKTYFWIPLAIAAVILTTIQKQFCERSNNIWDLSPVYMIVVLGMYLFIERVCIIKKKIGKQVVDFLAKYSFPVYIVHYVVKDYVVGEGMFGKLPQCFAPFPLWIVRIIIIYVISFLVGIIVENLIIKNIQAICKRILK